MSLFPILCLICSATTISASTVKSTHGEIEGTSVTLYDGKIVDAFLGIPYAAPPTGENRFTSPQKLAPWNNILPAKKLSKGCLQSKTEQMVKTMWYVSDVAESEDCLYLNVWRPQVTKESKMAIMIWIHGGGYIAGSGSMPLYNPSILASENDLIVVNMNYRLAQYGLLYLDDSVTPGNAGIKDQIQAIKWIRDNAEAFGGDPNRITLFGESGGSALVSFHLLNNDVIPMFQNAIMQSATANLPIASCSKADALQNSLSLAAKVGCPTENMKETFDCLTKADIAVLQSNSGGLLGPRGLSYCPVRNGIEVPFDTMDPVKNVPAAQRKNILGGNVPREMAIFYSDFFPDKTFDENLKVSLEEMTQTVKTQLQLEDDRLVSVVFHEYKSFDGTYDPNQLRMELMSLVSEFILICPQIRFMKDWISDSNKVFYYVFDHRPSKPIKFQIPEWAGTVHGEEIPFVFGAPMDPMNDYSEEDRQMSKSIMSYWTNFAKTGNPNGDQPQLTRWPSLSLNGRSEQLTFQKGVTKDPLWLERQCEFWSKVYPNLFSIQNDLRG